MTFPKPSDTFAVDNRTRLRRPSAQDVREPLKTGHNLSVRAQTEDPDRKCHLLAIGIDTISFSSALEELAGWLSADVRERRMTVAFLNAHNANVARKEPAYRAALASTSRVFPDGIGLRLAGRISGLSPLMNIPGTDLVPALLRHPAARGARVFLLGGLPESVDRLAVSFSQLFPSVELVGARDGYFSEGATDSVISEINSSHADLLLVGMGTPKQEEWVMHFSARLNPYLQITVGGLFQYWDRSLTRAPVLVRRQNLEWLWILLQHPHKWRRYLLGNPALLLHVALQRVFSSWYSSRLFFRVRLK